jgi:hypothetical protein
MKLPAKEVTKEFTPPKKKSTKNCTQQKPLQASGNFQK